MTVNYAFDLEDDDFFTDTFRSISENDLLTHSTPRDSLRNVHSNHTPNNPTKDSNHKEFWGLSEASPVTKLTGSDEEDLNLDSNKSEESITIREPHENPKVKFKEKNTDHESCGSKDNSNSTSIINSRFVPGFTPKAKKRKFPGPAGISYEQKDAQIPFKFNDIIPEKHSTLSDTKVEIENITSSQFSADELLLSSWQNLQAEVSSCDSLLSSAKYYSLHRVFHETSKKMPPKHIVVPLLCVLIKKFNPKDSTLVLIDDTGEICGKIDKNVLDIYKEYIKDGTALILKKVISLCNVLLLKGDSVVSAYLNDGSVRHFQDFNSALDKEEPLKPMSCGCTYSPQKRLSRNEERKICTANPAISAKSPISEDINRTSKAHLVPGPSSYKNLSENSADRLSFPSSASRETIPNVKVPATATSSERFIFSSNNLSFTEKHKLLKSEIIVPCITSIDYKAEDSVRNLTSNLEPKNCIVSETKSEVISGTMKSSITNLEAETLCEEFEMDDFDELLGSLDEKSFLATI